MSKSSRNRQAAQERIARLRAEEARRRRRRFQLGALAGVVAVAGAAAGIGLSATSGGGGNPAGPPSAAVAPLRTLGALRAAPPAGPTGPEGVPVPAARPLAGLSAAAKGHPVDGISCQASEQTLFHIHAHLVVIVNGVQRQVPAAVGIPAAQAQNTARGPFIVGGNCLYWLHTHAADGIIHVESPVKRAYTLGEFFDEWGRPLSSSRVGPAAGHVTAIYNGKAFTGNPRDIPLTAHAQIQLEVGKPLVAPQTISFPAGL